MLNLPYKLLNNKMLAYLWKGTGYGLWLDLFILPKRKFSMGKHAVLRIGKLIAASLPVPGKKCIRSNGLQSGVNQDPMQWLVFEGLTYYIVLGYALRCYPFAITYYKSDNSVNK